jgi:glucosamine-6-phosphate deaminase
MRQRVFENYDLLCSAVAQEVLAQIKRKPDSVLVFPTGNTPLGLFKQLVQAKRQHSADFSRAHFVILDEYVDLAPGDPRSLTGWLKRELLDPLEVPLSHTHGFEEGVVKMESAISRLGGIDLAILGLGQNGHLAFNEPGSAFNSRTRRVELTPESIKSNAVYWGGEDRVPRHGFTLGLATLADARSLILMVSGASKADILSQTLKRPVSPAIPATCFRVLSQAMLFADQAAMG